MEFKEIKSLSTKDLTKKFYDLKKNLFDMRMKNSLGQLSNPLQIRGARRDIARVMTALNNSKTSS